MLLVAGVLACLLVLLVGGLRRPLLWYHLPAAGLLLHVVDRGMLTLSLIPATRDLVRLGYRSRGGVEWGSLTDPPLGSVVEFPVSPSILLLLVVPVLIPTILLEDFQLYSFFLGEIVILFLALCLWMMQRDARQRALSAAFEAIDACGRLTDESLRRTEDSAGA